MTAEAVWWDLHCLHTLLESNLSRDFLFVSVFMGRCQSAAELVSSEGSQSIFSLQPSALVGLAVR